MNNFEFSEGFRLRTKAFAIRTIRLVQTMPRSVENRVIAAQLVKCATSVAANYRAACRARSSAEFQAKMNIVVEEADETLFWLELICDCEIFNPARLEPMIKEATEILSIVSRARKTIRKKLSNP